MTIDGTKMSRHYNHYEPRDNKVLRLNVGGQFYTTTRPTFQRYPESLLARIANGEHQLPRDDRNFLVIDRDGGVFRHILNYLRTDRVLLPDGFREVSLLREEAAYYQLPGLVGVLDGMLENRRRQMRRGNRGNYRGRGNNHGNIESGRKMSASVGDNLHLLQEEDDLDFIEDSWIGGALQ